MSRDSSGAAVATRRRRYGTWPFLPSDKPKGLVVKSSMGLKSRLEISPLNGLNARDKAVQFYCRDGYPGRRNQPIRFSEKFAACEGESNGVYELVTDSKGLI